MKMVIFAAEEDFSSKSSRMYDPGLRTGVSGDLGGLAITGVNASTSHLTAHMVKRVSHSQKTTFPPRVYSSYIRELFEENSEQLHNVRLTWRETTAVRIRLCPITALLPMGNEWRVNGRRYCA